MDSKICEERGCYALFWKNTKSGKKLSCLRTERNMILERIESCERASEFSYYVPKLFRK